MYEEDLRGLSPTAGWGKITKFEVKEDGGGVEKRTGPLPRYFPASLLNINPTKMEISFIHFRIPSLLLTPLSLLAEKK